MFQKSSSITFVGMDNNTFCPTNNFKPIVLNFMKKQTIGDQIYRASSNIKQIASNVWKVIWSQTISNQIYRASSNIKQIASNVWNVIWSQTISNQIYRAFSNIKQISSNLGNVIWSANN